MLGGFLRGSSQKEGKASIAATVNVPEGKEFRMLRSSQ